MRYYVIRWNVINSGIMRNTYDGDIRNISV